MKAFLLVSLILVLSTSCLSRNLNPAVQSEYWVSGLKHEEWAAFNGDPANYKVFRNVKDYGAVGDGVTDDTNAINLAISEGNRCGPGCPSSTISPAIVYFPSGNYLVSRPLLQLYYTQFIGDALNLPTLIMSPDFSGGLGLVTSDEYLNGPDEMWINQNNFFRQVRNLIIDMTQGPADVEIHGIHWQVGQAASITNVHVKMTQAEGNQQYGLWMENGSGQFFSDLTFEGGFIGLQLGNQQFTSRNIKITNADTAIRIDWNWGWTFKNIQIDNCKTGIDITASKDGIFGVGSAVVLDSVISNTDVAVKTAAGLTATPPTANTLLLDNVKFENVNQGVVHISEEVILPGGSQTIQSWGQGHLYDKNGQYNFVQDNLQAPVKSQALLDNEGNFFTKPKPMYTDVELTDFVSVKGEGAKGDGIADDTQVIQDVINRYAGTNKIVYFPHGHYLITDTIHIPPGTKIVGQIWSIILIKGNNFADVNNPKPVIEIGNPGEQGVVELSELIITTAGPAPGAILVQINMRESEKGSIGIWDVHFRIGGARGTNLQDEQCQKGGPLLDPKCFAAFLLLHITETGSAYLENVWVWVADHDIDGNNQISLYNGRGVLIESRDGPVWFYGTASEHSVLYQYNIANSKNIILAMIQIESPYYQGYPPAPQPFTPNPQYHDPDFDHCPDNSVTCPVAYGLRIVGSDSVYLYGAGLYSLFQNYNQDCLNSEFCQDTMVSLKENTNNVYIYNLNTKAADTMVEIDGKPVVKQADNRNGFCSTILALLP